MPTVLQRRQAATTTAVLAIGWTCWWWSCHRPRLATEARLRFRKWDRIQSTSLGCDPDEDEDDDDLEANANAENRSGILDFFAMLFPGLVFNGLWAKSTKKLRRTASAQRMSNMMRRQNESLENLAALGKVAPRPRPSVCFQGSGCVIVYHIGVARYMQEHFDLSNTIFLAASGGSIVAAMLALGISMDITMRENLRLAAPCRRLPFGPFGRILDDVAGAFESSLQDWTDEDVEYVLAGKTPRLCEWPLQGSGKDKHSWGPGHKLGPAPPQPRPDRALDTDEAVGGRLVLSLTHAFTFSPRLMRHFPTKETLVSSVWSSMNLPIFLCRFRPVCGEWFLDGGLTNNSPMASAQTVRVSPTDRTADITPDNPATAAEFLVPGDDSYMQLMHDQGYENAKRCHDLFLARGFTPRDASFK